MSRKPSLPTAARRLTAARETMTFALGGVRVTVTARRRTAPAVMVGAFRAMTEFVAPDRPRFGNGRDVRFNGRPDYELTIQRRKGPFLGGRDVLRALNAAADLVEAGRFPEPPRPRTLPPDVRADPIRLGAETLHWREFEQRVVAQRDVSLAWDHELADGFNRYFCERVAGCPPKPIVFDFRPGTRSLIGQHCRDRIRLRDDVPDDEKWRTLFHELAHYRVRNHPRAFVRELALVYRTWIAFRSAAESEVAPKPSINDSTPR